MLSIYTDDVAPRVNRSSRLPDVMSVQSSSVFSYPHGKRKDRLVYGRLRPWVFRPKMIGYGQLRNAEISGESFRPRRISPPAENHSARGE
jgi:hypothetical protein